MGGYQMEIWKMVLYMAFPVITFHYFNQPQYYAEAVAKLKREIYPPESESHNQQVREALNKIQQQRQLEELKRLSSK